MQNRLRIRQDFIRRTALCLRLIFPSVRALRFALSRANGIITGEAPCFKFIPVPVPERVLKFLPVICSPHF